VAPKKKAKRIYDRKRPPCDGCTARKRRCDREQPCERCDRKGIECVYRAPSKRERKREKAKRKVAQGADDVAPASAHNLKGEEHGEEVGAQDTSSDSDAPPPKAKRHSLPYELKKPKRRYGRRSMVNIDNSLLALLGRPLLPNLPAGKTKKAKVAPMATPSKQMAEGPATHSTAADARGGIRSSTFAAVMRLVAGLGPARATKPTVKLPAPGRAPPVWAQVSYLFSHRS
jgi:hypothetical protein